MVLHKFDRIFIVFLPLGAQVCLRCFYLLFEHLMLTLDFDELVERILRVLDVLLYREMESVQGFTNLLTRISINTVIHVLTLPSKIRKGILVVVVRRCLSSKPRILVIRIDVWLAPVAAHCLVISSPGALVVARVEIALNRPKI